MVSSTPTAPSMSPRSGRSCEIVTDGTAPPISASVTAAAMARNAAMPMVSLTGASSSMEP